MEKNKSEKILFFEKIVPNYRVTIYKLLNEKLNIISCHSKESKNSTLLDCFEEMRYENILLPRIYIGKFCFQNIISTLVKIKPKIVIVEFSIGYPTMWLLFILKYSLNYKIILHTHGIKNNILKDYEKKIWFKIALKLYNAADAIIVYSYSRNELISRHLKNKQKAFTANNTLNSKELINIGNKLRLIGKSDIKKKYRITTKYNLIYIGRLIKEKRIDLIIDVYKYLKTNYLEIDVGLLIIGDGPERNMTSDLKNQFSNTHWYGELKSDEKIGELSFISDLLINPGSLGLSILHSFFFFTPVLVCFNSDGSPYHGPEIDYFKAEYNGVACEQDIFSIVEKIVILLNNISLLEKLSANSYRTVIEHASVENMLMGFNQAIDYLT